MEAIEAAQSLMTYHGQKFSNEQLNDYVWFFDGQGDLDGQILAQWKRQNAPTSRFPSVAQLVSIADDLRIAKWQKKKESEPSFKELAQQNSTRTEHGKQAIADMMKLFDDPGPERERDEKELTPIERHIAWMFSMEIKYPALGWKEQAEDLRRFHTDKAKRHEIANWIYTQIENRRRGGSLGDFAQFNRPYVVKELPCMGCGQIFKLPFAHGDECVILCEDCNRKEGRKETR